MLSKNFELQQAEEQLKLELKIAKAQAREKVFTELENKENEQSVKKAKHLPAFLPDSQRSLPVLSTTFSSGLNRENPKHQTSQLNPAAPEFYYCDFPGGIKTKIKQKTPNVQKSIEELLI